MTYQPNQQSCHESGVRLATVCTQALKPQFQFCSLKQQMNLVFTKIAFINMLSKWSFIFEHAHPCIGTQVPASAFLHEGIVRACVPWISVLRHQHIQSSDKAPSVTVAHQHFITKCLSDSYTEIWQHTTCKHVTVGLHSHCLGLLLLGLFTELTGPKLSASTANWDIILLSCWQHCTTSTRQIFSFNRNSKQTQNCPLLSAVKFTPLLHF